MPWSSLSGTVPSAYHSATLMTRSARGLTDAWLKSNLQHAIANRRNFRLLVQPMLGSNFNIGSGSSHVSHSFSVITSPHAGHLHFASDNRCNCSPHHLGAVERCVAA